MYLKPADPDLQTLYNRIKSGDLDLQPEFQRGEVWSELKRQRLIDSILRDWQVPPVHVVVDQETDSQSVLDGQQRLAAIRDFLEGKLRINGEIEPIDVDIKRLHGMTFQDLPPDVRRSFERYSIRVFYVSDYSPEEPGELFFRLNQNSALSPAEQRNAFFGRARRQVKRFVELIETSGMQRAYFGFSNVRMAYDDILARSLLLLETGSLVQKVTSAQLVDRYRSREGFSKGTVDWLEEGLRLMMAAIPFLNTSVRLNKATALTWLVFSSRVARYSRKPEPSSYGEFICKFEDRRTQRSEAAINRSWQSRSLAIYEDRASARVGDVSSVVLRDFVLWLHFLHFLNSSGAPSQFEPFGLSHPSAFVLAAAQAGASIEDLAREIGWGSEL